MRRASRDETRTDGADRNVELIYGRQPVIEVCRAGRRRVLRVAVQAGRAGEELQGLLTPLLAPGVPLRAVPPDELERLVRGGNHQGVAAEVTPYAYAGLDEIRAVAAARHEDLFLLMLDHVQDPQNLGSLLRTAECVGVHGVVIPADRAAPVTAAVVRASAGASEHVRVARVPNLGHVMLTLKDEGVRFVSLEAVPEALPLHDADLCGPLCIVVGGEAGGVRRLTRERSDVLAALPMAGRVNSLNAAIAGAVALYEAARQRRQIRNSEFGIRN